MILLAVVAALGFSYLYTRGVSPVWAAVAIVCFPGFFRFIYKIACIVMAALILFAILSFFIMMEKTCRQRNIHIISLDCIICKSQAR